jgi:hypothetical protein
MVNLTKQNQNQNANHFFFKLRFSRINFFGARGTVGGLTFIDG